MLYPPALGRGSELTEWLRSSAAAAHMDRALQLALTALLWVEPPMVSLPNTHRWNTQSISPLPIVSYAVKLKTESLQM